MEKERKINYKKIISYIVVTLFTLYECLYSIILPIWMIWATAYFVSSSNGFTAEGIFASLLMTGIFQIIPAVLTIIAGILNQKLLIILSIILAAYIALTFLCFFMMLAAV